MATRIYLTGRVCIETDACTVAEHRIPTSDGRLLLASVAAERTAPAAVDDLAAQVWPTPADPARVIDEAVAGIRQVPAAAVLSPESLRCGSAPTSCVSRVISGSTSTRHGRPSRGGGGNPRRRTRRGQLSLPRGTVPQRHSAWRLMMRAYHGAGEPEAVAAYGRCRDAPGSAVLGAGAGDRRALPPRPRVRRDRAEFGCQRRVGSHPRRRRGHHGWRRSLGRPQGLHLSPRGRARVVWDTAVSAP